VLRVSFRFLVCQVRTFQNWSFTKVPDTNVFFAVLLLLLLLIYLSRTHNLVSGHLVSLMIASTEEC
jgi:hypothetical protein